MAPESWGAWTSDIAEIVCRRLACLGPQEQVKVRRGADEHGALLTEGFQNSQPRRVGRPELGEVETERPGALADNPFELGDHVSLQPTLEANDRDARCLVARDPQRHGRPARSSRIALATGPTIGIAITGSKITAGRPADGACARLTYRGAALEPKPATAGVDRSARKAETYRGRS